MSKFELLKKLKHLVAFQANQFAEGNWKEADLTENEIKKLEEKILKFETSASC
jgi:hypothetical protein